MLSTNVEEEDAPPAPRSCCCGLPYDAVVAFSTRTLRMINYGAIAPVFFLFCLELGLSEVSTGSLITAILLGDLVVTLYLTTNADLFIGRRVTMVVGAALKILAGAVFATTSNYYALVAAGVIGVISTSGGECGPFQAIEQAALTDAVVEAHGGGAAEVAVLYGWYNMVGYIGQAAGALTSGVAVMALQNGALGLSKLEAYRAVFVFYGLVGLLMALLYASMTKNAEPRPKAPAAAAAAAAAAVPAPAPAPCCPVALAPFLPRVNFGLRRSESRYIVARLSVMFAMDAFGGAFVMQTWIAFWFSKTYKLDSSLLGYLLMGANVVAGASGIAAAYFVKRLGAMLTMIVTHLPSNVLLLAVPLMPTGVASAAMLIARFSISQMDVPARQAYVTMVVASDERSAAGGITNLVRSLGMSLAPLLLGYLSAAAPGTLAFNSPWLIAGGVKIAYDVILYSLYRCDGTMSDGEAAAAKERAADKAAAAADADAARTKAVAAASDGTGDSIAEPLLAAEEGGRGRIN